MHAGLNPIKLPVSAHAAIVSHARNCAPQECCGLIASDEAQEVRFVYCLTNADASAFSFSIATEEFYEAFQHADRHGWEISGVFHSHPNGPDALSARDLEEADPSWINLLVGPHGLKAFRIDNGSAVEVPIEIQWCQTRTQPP